MGRPVYCAANPAAIETTFDNAYPFARSGAGNLQVSRVTLTGIQFCRKHVDDGREECDPQGRLNSCQSAYQWGNTDVEGNECCSCCVIDVSVGDIIETRSGNSALDEKADCHLSDSDQ